MGRHMKSKFRAGDRRERRQGGIGSEDETQAIVHTLHKRSPSSGHWTKKEEMRRTISYFAMGVDDSTGLLRGEIIDIGTLMVVRHGGEPQYGSPQGRPNKPGRRQGEQERGCVVISRGKYPSVWE